MNEPSVFGGPETSLPKDTIHVKEDGTEILHFNIHNIYGLMMFNVTYEALVQRDPIP